MGFKRKSGSRRESKVPGKDIEVVRRQGLDRSSRQVPPSYLEQQLTSLSRSPFTDVLQDIMQSQPSKASLDRMARKNPAGWAQMVVMFAKLSGYNEKVVHEHTIMNYIEDLSDQELQRAMESIERGDILELAPDGTGIFRPVDTD